MEILIEKIEHYEFEDLHIRIWTQNELPTTLELYNLYNDCRLKLDTFLPEALKEFKANAIEVIDVTGRGFVAYADWP